MDDASSQGFIQLLKEVGLYRETRAKQQTRSMKKVFAVNSIKGRGGGDGNKNKSLSLHGVVAADAAAPRRGRPRVTRFPRVTRLFAL